MYLILSRTILLALVTVLAVTSVPFGSVSAMGAEDPSIPPRAELTNEQLEKIWARQLRAYERIGKAEDFVERAQSLIDRASQNGKDVSAVQAALDAFQQAVNNTEPMYEGVQSIVDSHAGFDANGKVTDPEQAKVTVRAMGEKLKEIRDVMGGTGMELRDAIQAFRDANPRPDKTPTP